MCYIPHLLVPDLHLHHLLFFPDRLAGEASEGADDEEGQELGDGGPQVVSQRLLELGGVGGHALRETEP